MVEITMNLAQPAKHKGGDKYVGQIGKDEITFYIPQSVSRMANIPSTTIEVTIRTEAAPGR